MPNSNHNFLDFLQQKLYLKLSNQRIKVMSQTHQDEIEDFILVYLVERFFSDLQLLNIKKLITFSLLFGHITELVHRFLISWILSIPSLYACLILIKISLSLNLCFSRGIVLIEPSFVLLKSHMCGIAKSKGQKNEKNFWYQHK